MALSKRNDGVKPGAGRKRAGEIPRKRAAGPTGIGDILTHLIQNTSLGDQMRQARIWEEWTAIAGEQLAPHGRPAFIREGVLHVEANSPVWMHRFAFKKWAIIKRVNRVMEHEFIHDVFVLLASDDE